MSLSEDVLAVAGAGAMGAGIAQIGLSAGLRVILYDLDAAALARAGEQIQARLLREVEKGAAPETRATAVADRLTTTTDLADLAPADVVIEAVVERLEVKQTLFTALEAVVGPDAILATNTSSLPVAAIGKTCRRPERVCGLHFFNPVPLMKLVEVIAGPATSEPVVARALALCQRLGKVAVRVKDGPGFLVNLGGRAYTTEALHIEQEGVADPALIDQIMRGAADFRMGPFELMDLTGIDVNFPVTGFIWLGYQSDPRLKTTTTHEALFNAGRFGRKTGQGFFDYATPAAPSPPPPDDGSSRIRAWAPEGADRLAGLTASGLELSDADAGGPILLLPEGEDALSCALRLGIDRDRAVAVDLFGAERRFATLMAPLGARSGLVEVQTWLERRGWSVAVVKDSPGFVAPRIVASIINLGCELAQIGVGSPDDIDLAMKLGLNYPRGPLAWAEAWGPKQVYEVISRLHDVTGSDRYRPSLWLRRRALAGLSIRTPD
jgi:3-hydroxybutyryl-CoA dehydrogenase